MFFALHLRDIDRHSARTDRPSHLATADAAWAERCLGTGWSGLEEVGSGNGGIATNNDRAKGIFKEGKTD